MDALRSELARALSEIKLTNGSQLIFTIWGAKFEATTDKAAGLEEKVCFLSGAQAQPLFLLDKIWSR